MSKRRAATMLATGATSKLSRWQISHNTFKKWKTQYECCYQALLWLRCDIDKSDKTLVDTLWCKTCRQHKERLTGMKNNSSVWITGSTNHKMSSVHDQHKAAMILCRKASGQPVSTYSPIAQGLLVMDETVQARMKKKFDICYILAKEGLAFKSIQLSVNLKLVMASIMVIHTTLRIQLKPSSTILL